MLHFQRQKCTALSLPESHCQPDINLTLRWILSSLLLSSSGSCHISAALRRREKEDVLFHKCFIKRQIYIFKGDFFSPLQRLTPTVFYCTYCNYNSRLDCKSKKIHHMSDWNIFYNSRVLILKWFFSLQETTSWVWQTVLLVSSKGCFYVFILYRVSPFHQKVWVNYYLVYLFHSY